MRLIEGVFPDYRQVIPKAGEKTFTIGRAREGEGTPAIQPENVQQTMYTFVSRSNRRSAGVDRRL